MKKKTSDIDLKPCPFCGGSPSHWKSDNSTWHRIVCNNIFCEVAVMTIIDIEERVIEKWNKRSENK